jgi:SAM-dependent methyltransferase
MLRMARTKTLMKEDPPYKVLAEIYDNIVGGSVFPMIRRTFERIVKKYGIPFDSAADIGCGTGDFLCFMRRYGVPLFGVDRSPAMLRKAREKNCGSEIRLIHADIRALELPFRVDLITCNHDTLNYLLSRKDLERVVVRCRENLTPGGHLIFDMITGAGYPNPSRRFFLKVRSHGIHSTWRIFCDPAKRYSVVIMEYHNGERGPANLRRMETHIQRWYPFGLVRSLLDICGFRLIGAHDAETFLPAGANTPWIKYIAQKI